VPSESVPVPDGSVDVFVAEFVAEFVAVAVGLVEVGEPSEIVLVAELLSEPAESSPLQPERSAQVRTGAIVRMKIRSLRSIGLIMSAAAGPRKQFLTMF